MSSVPQAKGGAKRNLAKALAAGTREAGSASGRTSDNCRSPSRSRSPRRAVPLHAAWKHENVRSAAPKIQREGFRATETTAHTATTCGICSSRTRSAGWGLSTRLWRRKLLEHGVWPMLRVLVTTAGGLETWPEISAEPCKDLATGAAKTLTWCPFFLVHEVLESLVNKNSGDVSSLAAMPQQLWSVKRNFCAKHGIKDDLTLGLGLHGDASHTRSARLWNASPGNVLGSHSAERYLFGLVEKDPW